MSEKIGFIGLGIMGQGMTLNLLKAGFEVTVWNRTASRMETAVNAGATAAASPKEVAEKSDIIITCVSDTPDVEAVILGETGVIHGAKAGSLVVDMSTISPQTTRNIAKTLAEKEIRMLDAPISGGSEGAVKGTLSIMIGGDATDVTRAMSAFEAMGSKI
ncbi:MAG: NAD(P)-binding domain-containing protein, partial [Chloroflexota bacterium]